MAFNITIVSPIQNKLAVRALNAVGVAAEEGEVSKIAKCKDKCRKAGFDFIPPLLHLWYRTVKKQNVYLNILFVWQQILT